ncbi:MAG TPA: hypothetical protein VK826_01260 [Bacteroidia bacterium]|nr:hypothetical protein [Bacteroidia bacterium]
MGLISPDKGLLLWILVLVLIFLLIFLIPNIFYVLTLSRTLKQCAPHNQRMQPGQLWLVLIPLFNLVWHFIVVTRMADSLAAEFRQRNIPLEEDRPGYTMGMTFCILGLCGWIPYIGSIASLAGLVCWIIYWVKIAGYKRRLEEQLFQFGAPNPYQAPNQYPQNPQ